MRLALAGAGVLGALAARWPLLPHESGDYLHAVGQWWKIIVENGRFAALDQDFAIYSVPYLYLLAAGSYLDPWARDLTVIKGISIFFDFLLAYFVFLCVRLRYPAPSLLPTGAALAVLFAPTVVMNSAMWGQADSIYTAFLAGALYLLLTGRRAWAFAFFGLAFSIKLQAIFFAPVLLWLLVKREARWREALLSPLVFLLSLVPAWWVGRPFGELVFDYEAQMAESHSLIYNAPTLYAWIPPSYREWAPLFVGAAGILLLLITDFLVRSRRGIGERLTLLATFAVLLTPSILPHMRERYFYPAETLSVVFAFCYPRYWFVPTGLWLLSTPTYLEYLLTTYNAPDEWLALGMLALLVALGVRVHREFRGGSPSFTDRARGSGPPITAHRLLARWWQFPRSAIWLAVILTAATSAVYGGHLVLLHRAAAERLEAAGAPAVPAPWAVYLEERSESRNLLYFQQECYPAQDRFVLHLYPEDPTRLPPVRRRYGFENRDFEFQERAALWGTTCFAFVPLPDYPLSSIVTGQVRRRDDGFPEFAWLHRFRPPGAETDPSAEAASGQFEGPVDPERYGTPLSALAAGEWGPLAARSDFDLYLHGQELRYYKEPCAPMDVNPRFHLYLYSPSSGASAGEVLNRDFDFYEYGIVEDGKCLALVPLPDGYSAFRTGQWAGSTPWQVEGRLDRDRFRTALDSFATGEWGAPIVRSVFDLYLEDNELRYYMEPCAPTDVAARFILEFHQSRNRLEPGESVNRDFDFYEHGVIEDGKCLAIVPLPTEGYASLETGQYGEETSWRAAAVLDRAHYRAALDSLDRGEWGEPEVRADFDLYLADDELRYVREECADRDVEVGFFLHLHGPPVGTTPGSSGNRTFENRDFDFAEHGLRLDGRCLALVPLPTASAYRIATGQFTAGGPPVWRTDLWPARRLLESRLEAITAGELGPPTARSKFDLYLEETALLFHRRSCSESDLEEKFFLHLYPEDENDLPAARRDFSFENRDFAFLDQGFLFDEACLARIPLPDYPLARLRTGQFRPGSEPSWTAELWPGLRETTR